MGILDGLITGYTNAILGPAPTDVGGAYAKLQTELNSKYDKQKQAFEADPANKGKAFQMPDYLQRWNDQIQGMMASGDPTLQKEALEQMNQYYQRATEAKTDNTPDAVRQYEYARAQGYDKSFQQWKMENAAAGRTNISIGGQGGSALEGVNFLTDAEKQKLNLPINTAYYKDKNGNIKEPPGGFSIEQLQQQRTVQLGAGRLGDLLFNEEDGVYPSNKRVTENLNVPAPLKRAAEAGTSYAQTLLQQNPNYKQAQDLTKAVAVSMSKAYFGEKGAGSEGDVARAVGLFPNVVTDGEDVARQKMDYVNQVFSQTDPTKALDMINNPKQYTNLYKSKPKAAAKQPSKSVDSNLEKVIKPAASGNKVVDWSKME